MNTTPRICNSAFKLLLWSLLGLTVTLIAQSTYEGRVSYANRETTYYGPSFVATGTNGVVSAATSNFMGGLWVGTDGARTNLVDVALTGGGGGISYATASNMVQTFAGRPAWNTNQETLWITNRILMKPQFGGNPMALYSVSSGTFSAGYCDPDPPHALLGLSGFNVSAMTAQNYYGGTFYGNGGGLTNLQAFGGSSALTAIGSYANTSAVVIIKGGLIQPGDYLWLGTSNGTPLLVVDSNGVLYANGSSVTNLATNNNSAFLVAAQAMANNRQVSNEFTGMVFAGNVVTNATNIMFDSDHKIFYADQVVYFTNADGGQWQDVYLRPHGVGDYLTDIPWTALPYVPQGGSLKLSNLVVTSSWTNLTVWDSQAIQSNLVVTQALAAKIISLDSGGIIFSNNSGALRILAAGATAIAGITPYAQAVYFDNFSGSGGIIFRGNGSTVGAHITASTFNAPVTLNANAVYVTNDCSALSFTDRSDSPETLMQAYEIVSSHQPKGKKVDHAKLSPLAGDSEKRNLSMVISAQQMVIQDLLKRIEKLEGK